MLLVGNEIHKAGGELRDQKETHLGPPNFLPMEKEELLLFPRVFFAARPKVQICRSVFYTFSVFQKVLGCNGYTTRSISVLPCRSASLIPHHYRITWIIGFSASKPLCLPSCLSLKMSIQGESYTLTTKDFMFILCLHCVTISVCYATPVTIESEAEAYTQQANKNLRTFY
ncbi:hypothetical protein T12_16241, partial [Trichinella patagoniensis]